MVKVAETFVQEICINTKKKSTDERKEKKKSRSLLCQKMKILTRKNIGYLKDCFRACRELNFVVKLTWCPKGLEVVCMDSYNSCGIECVIKMIPHNDFCSSDTTSVNIENYEKCLKDVSKGSVNSCNLFLLQFALNGDMQIVEINKSNSEILTSFEYISDPCRKYEKMAISSDNITSFVIDSKEIYHSMLNVSLFSATMRVVLTKSGDLSLMANCEYGQVTINKKITALVNNNNECNNPDEIICDSKFIAKFVKVLSLATSLVEVSLPLKSNSPMSIKFSICEDEQSMLMVFSPL